MSNINELVLLEIWDTIKNVVPHGIVRAGEAISSAKENLKSAGHIAGEAKGSHIGQTFGKAVGGIAGQVSDAAKAHPVAATAVGAAGAGAYLARNHTRRQAGM